jgi:hypothetical protein
MAEPSVKIFEDPRFTATLRGISTICSTIAAAGVLAIGANMYTLNRTADKLTYLYETLRGDLNENVGDTKQVATEQRQAWREIDKMKISIFEIQRRLQMR